VAAAAAAAARAGSLLTVLVIIIGSYPGAVTVPPETIETAGVGVELTDPPALATDYETSRIGAPKFTDPDAKALVCFAAI